jgi:hypothetical protein
MWTDVLGAMNWLLVWFLGALFLYFCIQRLSFRESYWKKWRPYYFVGLLFVALLVRLVPSVLLPVGAGFDVESFRLVAEALLAGEDVYTSAAVGRHPYLPLYMYAVGLSLLLSQSTFIPFVVWVKFLPVAGDVVITGVVFVSAKKLGKSPEKAAFMALLYALNPISILVSAYHAQFDSIPLLLLLLSWYYGHFDQKPVVSGLFLGFAVLVKTWPIVFLPVVLLRMQDWKARVFYVLLTIGIPVVFTVMYIFLFSADPSPMLKRALTHTGNPGYWGPGSILAVVSHVDDRFVSAYTGLISINKWLIISMGLVSLWVTRKNTALSALLTIILCVFMVSIGMGMQWLLWVVPFALLAGDRRWLNYYSLAGTAYLLAHLYGYHMYPWANEFLDPQSVDVFLRLTALPTWIVVVMWAGMRLLRSMRMQETAVSEQRI